jgi:CRISPR-associated exonuclease Cas4
MSEHEESVVLPLHAFNQWAFCPYRFWLMYGCGEMIRNEHVYRGRRYHRRIDQHDVVGTDETPIVRSLRVHHPTLGLTGVIDLLDRNDQDEPIPVETKAGHLRGEPWENDILQVAAQALCVEHTLGANVPYGMIFYAGSRRRVRVDLSPERRDSVNQACFAMRMILCGERSVRPSYANRCEGCSLFDLCLPHAAGVLEEIS